MMWETFSFAPFASFRQEERERREVTSVIYYLEGQRREEDGGICGLEGERRESNWGATTNLPLSLYVGRRREAAYGTRHSLSGSVQSGNAAK